MKVAGRLGLIALTLVLLSAPAGAVCEALGDWMAGCHEATSHDMPGCSDEISLTTSCCGASLADAETDLVLKRPGEEDVLLADACLQSPADGSAARASGHAVPAVAPPPRAPSDAHRSILRL